MTTAPYRIQPPDRAMGQVSLRELPEASLLEMPRLHGAVCADMYGDLPYGLFLLSEAEIRGAPGYIYTREGRPILEQNAGFLRKKKFLRPRYAQVAEVASEELRTASLVSLLSTCHNCFWHWMGDSLPKVFLAEECGFQGSYLIPPPTVAPWALESMQLVGIVPSRLIIHNQGVLRATQLFVPSHFCGYNAHHNSAFVRMFRDWIRHFVPKAAHLSTKRILVGRRPSAKARRVLNQDAVEGVAQEFGFTMIYFEDLSLREQLSLACSAEAILAPHSSGLTHLLFMDENALVIELFPLNRQQSCDCYETLSLVTPHRYHALESQTPQEGDIEVDTHELRMLLATELTKH